MIAPYSCFSCEHLHVRCVTIWLKVSVKEGNLTWVRNKLNVLYALPWMQSVKRRGRKRRERGWRRSHFKKPRPNVPRCIRLRRLLVREIKPATQSEDVEVRQVELTQNEKKQTWFHKSPVWLEEETCGKKVWFGAELSQLGYTSHCTDIARPWLGTQAINVVCHSGTQTN